MITGIILLAIACSGKQLPDGLKFALERHLPAWAQITSNAAPSSDSTERIAVERTGSLLEVFLLDRKIQLSVLQEEGRYWIENARWCAESGWKGRCPKVWNRTDSAWNATRENYDKTGYDVFRDSLRMQASSWTDPVPPLDSIRSKWDKAACRSGLCFLVRAKDSSVGAVAIRPEGSIAWWDGGYIKDIPNEIEMVHAYRYLLEQGRSFPFKGPVAIAGKSVWYDPSNKPSTSRASRKSAPTPSPSGSIADPLLADSLEALFAAVESVPEQTKPKGQSASRVEALSKQILSGKVLAKRAAGTDECSGTDRVLRRFADGSHVLLQGKRVVAVQLQDSSLKAYALNSSMTTKDVVGSLGTPSRRDATLFVYETEALDPKDAEVDQVHWKILIQFRDGRVFRAIFLRLFDDC